MTKGQWIRLTAVVMGMVVLMVILSATASSLERILGPKAAGPVLQPSVSYNVDPRRGRWHLLRLPGATTRLPRGVKRA